jgi:hypothetical protein
METNTLLLLIFGICWINSGINSYFQTRSLKGVAPAGVGFICILAGPIFGILTILRDH